MEPQNLPCSFILVFTCVFLDRAKRPFASHLPLQASGKWRGSTLFGWRILWRTVTFVELGMRGGTTASGMLPTLIR